MLLQEVDLCCAERCDHLFCYRAFLELMARLDLKEIL